MAGVSEPWKPLTHSTGPHKFEGDYFFSTAPVKELLRSFDVAPPAIVLEVS